MNTNPSHAPPLAVPRAPTHGNEAAITLELLDAIQADSGVTQRSVARNLGIALGLANTYLKRCVKKGLVKVAQVPSNRYAYYLTPRGFSEKSRLTATYLSQSFLFFREARGECEALFAECARRGWRRVALVGASDLGEIATLCARDSHVAIAGFVDPGNNVPAFAGYPVRPDLAAVREADAAIVVDLKAPQATYDALKALLPAERILHPGLLRIADGPARADEAAGSS